MTQNNPQLRWTDEQWDRVQQVIWEEARKARVAAAFLPVVGPLPPDTDYVSLDELNESENNPSAGQIQPGGQLYRLRVEDTETKKLSTLETKVYLRGPQVSDPELTSALQIFRRAANVLARLEDAVVFNGTRGLGSSGAALVEPKSGHEYLPKIWQIGADKEAVGLHDSSPDRQEIVEELDSFGNGLVSGVSAAIGTLEARGHFGPFAVVLGQKFFSDVQTPNSNSLALPQDRILPLLGGGPLLRCSVLASDAGVVVALSGAPIDLVLARDMRLSFLQINLEPRYVFRLHEKLALRIKQKGAVITLAPKPLPTSSSQAPSKG